MVKVPVVITLAVELPDRVPNSAEVITATLAGPPAERPATASEKSMNSLPVPDTCTKAPNTMNSTMYVADTPMGMPKMPSVDMYRTSIR